MAKTTAITRRADLPEIARQELAEAGLDLNVGDIYMRNDKGYSDYAELLKIVEIRVNKKGQIDYISYGRNTDWEGTEFSDSYGGESSAGSFKRKMEQEGWLKVTPEQIAEYNQIALDVISGKRLAEEFKDSKSDVINSETALIGKDTKVGLMAMQGELEKKSEHAQMIARFIGREMAKRKQELENIKKQMYAVVAEFQKKIERIMRVITTIELYLGIEEEIFCIQEGQKAPADTPITFRQAVLYMDEEIGHYEDGGLDFSNVEWFDKWLADGNYKSCFPEEKGIVVFRPRRKDKDYSGYDPILKERYNSWNRVTYLLIRNGECLHRVYTNKIRIQPTLFPMRNELQELMKEMQELMSKGDNSWSSDERKKDEIEDIQYQYRKRAVLMQGLIDRTELLHPLPAPKVNIFNLDELGDKVRFIYDAEAALGQGKLTFWDWHKKLNESIQHGSRVLLTGYYYNNYSSKLGDFVRNRIYFYCGEYNTPPVPDAGIYDVDEYKLETREWLDEKDYEEAKDRVSSVLDTRQDRMQRHWDMSDPKYKSKPVKNTDDYIKEYHVVYIKLQLTILHNPNDEVTGGWGDYDPHERKKRIRFRIQKSDKFVLNYDMLDMADVDFYLNSRIDRPNYLEMMPVLQKVKGFLVAEQVKEEDFKKLIFQQVYSQLAHLGDILINARIDKSLTWWKYKNQLKRAITKDDTLALRMMVKRVTSKNWATLKWD